MSRARVAVVFASGMVVVAGLSAPARLLASGPMVSAFTAGVAGCEALAYLLPPDPSFEGQGRASMTAPCERWDANMPFDALAWDFRDERAPTGVTPTGIAFTDTASETASLRVTLDEGGAFSSAMIGVDLRSDIQAGGSSETRQNFSIAFDTSATTLAVGGSVLGERGGDEVNGGFGAFRLGIYCGPAPGATGQGILELDLPNSGSADGTADASETQPLDATVVTDGGPCLVTLEMSTYATVVVADAGADAFAHERLDLRLTTDAGP